MCEFLSFVLADKGQGLEIFTAPDLDSHGPIIVIHELTGCRHYEAEWTDTLEIRIPGDESEAKREYLEGFVESRFSGRDSMAEYWLREYLNQGITPPVCYFTWLAPALVEWAIDCAERVLPIWEAKYPDDARPRQAIQTARNNPRAAYAAADAAYAAARAAYAAADAARYAAAYAARAAAYAAYAADEKQWQASRLLEILDKKVEAK